MQDAIVGLVIVAVLAWNYRIGHPEWNPIRLGHLIRANKKKPHKAANEKNSRSV
jgi:hypothetical protein